MVVDLPDLGQVPANGGSEDATALSMFHNLLLDGAVARLRAQYPNLRLTLLELDPLFSRLRTTMEARVPALDVFAPLTPGLSTCLFVNPASCSDAPDPLQCIVRVCLLGCRASDDRSASLSG